MDSIYVSTLEKCVFIIKSIYTDSIYNVALSIKIQKYPNIVAININYQQEIEFK